jgi:hypothetical protein
MHLPNAPISPCGIFITFHPPMSMLDLEAHRLTITHLSVVCQAFYLQALNLGVRSSTRWDSRILFILKDSVEKMAALLTALAQAGRMAGATAG